MTWILSLETELKPDTRPKSFPSKNFRLNKNSVHSFTVLYSHKPSLYLLRIVLFLPVVTDSPDTGEQQKAKWRASAGSTRIAFITFLPGTRLCRRLLRITTTLSSRLIRHPRVQREFTART